LDSVPVATSGFLLASPVAIKTMVKQWLMLFQIRQFLMKDCRRAVSGEKWNLQKAQAALKVAGLLIDNRIFS
jgi:hypothetical protein